MAEYIEQNHASEVAFLASEEHPYEKNPGNPETFSDYNRGWKDACEYISDIMEHISAEKAAPKWISVQDRLPEPYTRCLVYRYDRVTKTHFIDFLWFAGIWRVAPDYGVADDTVTHWMPLPEPPKEGADNDRTETR